MKIKPQPVPTINGRTYIQVRAQHGTVDFGHIFSEPADVVIQMWKDAGGIRLPGSSSFIPWHTIQSIDFDENYTQPYHAPSQ